MVTAQKYCSPPQSGKKFALVSLLFVGLISGCGYTLNHRLQDNFNSPRGLFVPVFTNRTQEVGSEIIFTDALVRELLSHGEKVAWEESDDTLKLRGTVTQIDRAVEVQSAAGVKGLQAYQRVPDQIGVRVFVLMELVDPRTKTVKWSKDFSTYRRVSAPLDRMTDADSPSSLGLITESLIENSYPLIARDLMRDVYDSMVEVF